MLNYVDMGIDRWVLRCCVFMSTFQCAVDWWRYCYWSVSSLDVTRWRCSARKWTLGFMNGWDFLLMNSYTWYSASVSMQLMTTDSSLALLFPSLSFFLSILWCIVVLASMLYAILCSQCQDSHASWKVLDFLSWKFQDLEGPGKSLWSWKVLEIKSPGKISLKVMHFSSGSNGKQAAIV